MSLRFLIAFVAVLFAATHSEPSLAQFGGGAGDGLAFQKIRFTNSPREHVQQVVVSNAQSLDGKVIALVAQSVAQRIEKETSIEQILLQSGGGRVSETMEIQLLVIGYVNPDADAQLLWDKARTELERALRRVQQRTHEARVRDHKKNMERVLTQIRDTQERFGKITAELGQEDSGADGDIESLRADLRKMTSQTRELGLEQIGMEARRKAIERRIDELRARMSAAAADDPLLAEMKKIVAARQELVKKLRMLDNTGQKSVAVELSNAEAEYAAAQAQLIRAQREAGGRADGAFIQELNNQLSTLMINAAELAEKQKAFGEQIAMLRERINPQRVAESEMLKARVQLAQQHLVEVEQRFAQLDRQELPELLQITIRPLEEALLGDEAEAPPAENP
jgi:hypothetical protein